MSVLVDTSIWMDHFRHGNEALAGLLALDQVMTHPMVVGELACGTLPTPRNRTLHDIGLLRPANTATHAEVLAFIEREKLYGPGCGYIDMHLLASALMTPDAALWTLDGRLAELAARFGVAHD